MRPVWTIVVGACLVAAAAETHGQGLAEAAAREKARRERERAEARPKPRPRVYDEEALKRYSEGGEGDASTAAPASSSEDAPSQAADTTASEKAAEPLGWCGDFGMLNAWGALHRQLEKVCGGDGSKTYNFTIELVVSKSGTVESAAVSPQTPYTTCVRRQARGSSLQAPDEGQRCRVSYSNISAPPDGGTCGLKAAPVGASLISRWATAVGSSWSTTKPSCGGCSPGS